MFETSNEDKPMAAFVLSLIAGILILIGGVNSMTFMSMVGYGMMGQGYYMYAGLGLLVLISGIIVIIGAVMIQSKP